MTRDSVDLDGIRWAYDESGEGPLLLLFHGTLSGKAVYSHQIPVLATRCRAVAVDWPGHGDSGFDPAGWTVADLVDSVPRLIDALGERTAILAGVSQGGAISMRVALRSPERVDGLVTMSAGPDPPGAEAVATMAALGNQLAHGTDAERRAALENLQRKWFHAPGWVDVHPEEAEREIALMLGHTREAMPGVTRIPTTYDSIEARLGEISCPTLVIWGEHDVRAYWGPPMAEQIPDARLVSIPGAGHHVTLDAPEEVATTIAAFVDELDGQGRRRDTASS
jgi:pimeloyl-ACP methyl ester carboxylesterase